MTKTINKIIGVLILAISVLVLAFVLTGCSQENKLLTIVSGVSVLSVVIYVFVSQYSRLIQDWSKKIFL